MPGRHDALKDVSHLNSAVSRGRLTWQLLRPYGKYWYYQLRPDRRPEYFQSTWKLPQEFLSDATPVLNPDDTTFVFLPMVDWHVRMQRPQQLALALARLGHTCIYVNPHLGCEYPLPYLFDSEPRVGRISDRIFELHVHLPHEHESHSRGLRAPEVARVVDAVAALTKRCGISNAVQVVSFAKWLDVALALRAEHDFPLIYDCHDRWDAFPRISREIVARESELLAAADHVSFSSDSLRRAVLGGHSEYVYKSSVIGNAVSSKDFTVASGKPRRDHRPTIGYAGALEEWFDVDAVLHAAQALPHCRFEIVGRVECGRLQRLRKLPNVEFAGEVPYRSLPQFLHRWDAAMIPFLVNRVTSTVDPIKLYEYFSIGLPVVATALPEVSQRYSDLVYVGRNAAEFTTGVEDALAESGVFLRQRRREVAGRETWLNRARAMQDLSRSLQSRASATVA
jgi:glycosyltransferase involved in cell wall biosynthesis